MGFLSTYFIYSLQGRIYLAHLKCFSGLSIVSALPIVLYFLRLDIAFRNTDVILAALILKCLPGGVYPLQEKNGIF